MLEERAYSKEELAESLGTSDTQGMKRKLETHKIDFTTTGRGKSLIFNLVKIQDPFRVLCITDLGFAPNTDFKKLRNFMYYFMNDDDFRWLPDEVLEVRMREMGEDKGVSRQTIGKWKAKLSAMDIVNPSGEYTYYFAYAHRQILTDKETYCKAWREYFAAKEEGMPYEEAISSMIFTYGGVARKQSISDVNAFYANQINQCLTESLISDVINYNQDLS